MDLILDRLVIAAWLAPVIALCYGVGLAIYRLYFHPLSEIPGPKLYVLSELTWAIDNQLQGLFNKRVLKFHQQYGPIVRTGPNRLSIDGTIGWPEIFGHGRSNAPEFSHWSPFYSTGAAEGQSIFTTDRSDHRRHRRLMAHAFSEAAIAEQEVLVKHYVDLLIKRLKESVTEQEPVDIVKWYNYTTFDIIGDLVFAEPFKCLENSDYHPWVAMIFDSIRTTARVNFLLRFPLFRPVLQLITTKEELQKREDTRIMSVSKAERRIALGSTPAGRKDIMTYLLRHNDEKGMSQTELQDNSHALIVAGSETTATGLSGLTYYISKNPTAMKRLQVEIREAFKSEDEITMKATARLPYLHACIEEALRIYPPAPETPPRISPGGFVSGHYIPKGTFITVPQWANHNNPANFKNPDSYIPERWLSPDHPFYDAQFSTDKKSTMQPFSFGPRNCIGKNLAYAELRLVVARTFWNFDFEVLPGQENWAEKQKIFTVWEKTPLMIQLSLARQAV